MSTELLYRFGTAAAIGLLVGLQREFAYVDQEESTLAAGVRTFALLGLTGCTGALLADELGSPWGLVAPIFLVGALVVVAYLITAKRGDVGMTTEIAAIVTLLAGALCYFDREELAVALGVVVTLLLSFKLEIHQFTRRLTREDIIAIVKFGVITAIVLPVLPRTGLGEPPFDVLNPHRIWLMVVLISGLSFLGYVVMKLMESEHGIALTGFLGGLASSTAVTLTFSQRSQHESGLSRIFGIAVLIAWVTMFVRVVVEVAVVNRILLDSLWIPMFLAALSGALYCVFLARSKGGEHADHNVDFSNPFELGPAIRFGALYGLILLVSRIAQIHFGHEGIYISSVIAGFTDVDAITLSMAELSLREGGLDPAVASRAITLAAMANTGVKAGIVLVTGSPEIKRAVVPGFLLILSTGLGAAFLI
ncbi:MAG TPA: MgtC/SapB family protein [Vicinamibacteria bacterium]|nr:MgtC/SapB family protein [Vicinamibacteria bacterium]